MNLKVFFPKICNLTPTPPPPPPHYNYAQKSKSKFDLKIKEVFHINWIKPNLNSQQNHFAFKLSL